MAKLELRFSEHSDLALLRADFTHDETTSVVYCAEGNEPRMPWRAGAIAHMWFFVSLAERAAESCEQPETIWIDNDSPANSVKDSLTKQLVWRNTMFGVVSITDLILTGQVNQRQRLRLNEKILPLGNIDVYVDDVLVTEDTELNKIAEHLKDEWIKHRASAAKPVTRRSRAAQQTVTDDEHHKPRAIAGKSLDLAEHRFGSTAAADLIIQVCICHALTQLRRNLQRTCWGLESLADEIWREPKGSADLQLRSTELLNEYTAANRLAADLATVWAELSEVLETANTKLRSFEREMRRLTGGGQEGSRGETTLNKAEQAIRNCKDEVWEVHTRVTELRAQAIFEFEEIRDAFEQK